MIVPSRGGLEFVQFPGVSLRFTAKEYDERHILCCAVDTTIPGKSEVWVETDALDSSSALMITEPKGDAEVAKSPLGGRILSEGLPSHVLFVYLGQETKVV